MESALPWLDRIVGLAAGTAVALLVVVNGAFALGLVLLRDRSFVNRWTKPLVVTDAILLTAAVGVPIIGIAAKLGMQALGLLSVAPTAAVQASK